MTKLRIFLVLLIVACALPLCAQVADSTQAVEINFPQKTVEGANSLLWKIEGDALEGTSYLYGTMHLPNSKVIGLFDSIGNVIGRCDAVAVELVINPKEAFGMVLKMMMKDTTLKDLYTPEEYKLVRGVLKEKMGATSFLANKIKPIFLSTLIEEGLYEADMNVVLDQYIQDIGTSLDKEIIGIETAEEQLSALDVLSLEEQADIFLEYIDGMEDADSLGQELFTTYLNQDLDAMSQMDDQAGMPDRLYESMVTKRNYIMAERTLALMKEKPTYIAVGALHLVGETGLVELFRKEGLTVTATRK